MDWSWLGSLFSCQAGNEQLHRVVLFLSGSANLFAVIAALYAFWRWWTKPPKDREGASALRDEGEFRASLKHRQRAMALYDLSIRLNPSAAHVHYLRGCLLEELGKTNRAIAAWERCVKRLANHDDAHRKLAEHGVTTPSSDVRRWAFRLSAGATAIVFIVLASGFIR